MKRWISIVFPLIMVFALVSYSFKSQNGMYTVPESLRVNDPFYAEFPIEKPAAPSFIPTPPFVGTSFIGFREALAFKESRGDYFTTNTLGYLGKYQFGLGTLQLMGVYNATKFLKDPKLQEKAFHTNLARNKWILRRDIPRFVGKRMNGIEITESGILAAAHLAGPGNVKKFLRSYGSIDVSDAYGTSISHYLKKFKGYDVSHILPVKNPKI